jgi:uncharacterized protein YbaA (DUF1428 family)
LDCVAAEFSPLGPNLAETIARHYEATPGRGESASNRGKKSMAYVDGFVAAVPTANRDLYKKHAEAAAIVFKEHGATKLVECWGDDVPEGKLTSFPMAVKRTEDETVVFSWIIWPSRKVRDDRRSRMRIKP